MGMHPSLADPKTSCSAGEAGRGFCVCVCVCRGCVCVCVCACVCLPGSLECAVLRCD